MTGLPQPQAGAVAGPTVPFRKGPGLRPPANWTRAKELAAQDDDELRVEIESRIGQARQKRTQALQAASEILDLARTVSEVDKNRSRYVGEARARPSSNRRPIVPPAFPALREP